MTGTGIAEEKRVVLAMVELYCLHHHGGRGLCAECQELLTYAHRRLDLCRYGELKGTCRQCPVHCYSPAMASRMREVMRWAGPRMLLYHPMMAVKHILREHFINNRK